MSKALRFAIGVTALVAGAGTAAAADLTGDQIKQLVSGRTLYLETIAAGSITGVSGQGQHYYNPDGSAIFKTPKGEIWTGKWTIKDNTICVDWKQSPNNPCTRYDKQGDAITLLNATTGQPRAKILKSADGNPEKLAP